MTELEKWAEALPDRRRIIEFIEWLQSQSAYRYAAVVDLHPDRVLDAYHGIDQRKLDDERRAFLKECP